MALHGSSVSLSDKLFARPRADPCVLFPHASSRAARGCVWSGCTQHHSLPSPPRVARVEGVVFRLVVNFAMPCLWPLLCVAGNTSSLELVPRRSARCAFRRALLCSVSRDRLQWSFLPLPVIPCRRSARVCSEHLRVGRSWIVAMVWLSPASASGLQSRRSSVVATLRSCRRCGCVSRCQRALLDVDMLELIDRSACLVEPVTVESCAPPVLVLSPQQARPAPRPVAARECPFREALWKVFCSLGCSFRAPPVASLRLLSLTGKSWMIWSFHCFVMWSTSCAS